jgi:hypothetical protein
MQTREGRGASSSIAQQPLHRPLAVGSRARRERRRRGGGREEDSRAVGKKTTGGSEGAGDRGPTLLLQGATWPRGDGKRWRPSSTRKRPPPPTAQARFAKGRRRRRPWICLTGGPGRTSRCRIRAWGGRGRSDDGEGGGVEHAVDGRDAAPLLRARAGRGRSSPSPPSAVLAVEDAPSSRSAGISAAPRELRSAPAAQISRAGRTARYIPVRRGEGDGWGHAVSARGRALLAGSVAGRLLAKSRRGGERERGGQRLGCSVPKDARVGGIVAFCSMLCGSRWSRYSTARVCKTQMQHQLQHLLEMVLAGCDSS